MNVVYPECWQRKALREDVAEAFVLDILDLEEELREAGFALAADLVAAGEVAIRQQIARETAAE